MGDGKAAAGGSWSHPTSFPRVPALRTPGLTFLNEEAAVDLRAEPSDPARKGLGNKRALPGLSPQPGVCLRLSALKFCATLGTRNANYPGSKFSI